MNCISRVGNIRYVNDAVGVKKQTVVLVFAGTRQRTRQVGGKVVQQTNHIFLECNPPSLTHNPSHPPLSCLSGTAAFPFLGDLRLF